jgi:hypothetical protein
LLILNLDLDYFGAIYQKGEMVTRKGEFGREVECEGKR